MSNLQVGDKVKAVGSLQPSITLYEGIILEMVPLGNDQMCLIEIAEGSGFWSHVKLDTISSSSLQKITEAQ